MQLIKEKIISAYEQLAERYNQLIDHKPHNAYYDRPNTLELIPQIEGKSILDAACGPGKYAEILLSKGARVTGFDISPKMVDLAKERNQGAGNFLLTTWLCPFQTLENESFDIVLCALALHYLQDWNLTMQEFYRVLKPKGRSCHLHLEYRFLNTITSTRKNILKSSMSNAPGRDLEYRLKSIVSEGP